MRLAMRHAMRLAMRHAMRHAMRLAMRLAKQAFLYSITPFLIRKKKKKILYFD